MTLAAYSIQPDCYAEWQAANGAAWCQRLSATITPTTCEEQRRLSGGTAGDLRCQSCKGLYGQPGPQLERPVLTFVHNAEQEPKEPANADTSNERAEIGADDRRENRCQIDDEALDEFLAEMFPDDADDDEDEGFCEHAYIEEPHEAAGHRVAVFMGRCPRCGGYMTNDRERQFDVRDEDVYRCFTCGWRTSPRYENNRALFAHGMEV